MDPLIVLRKCLAQQKEGAAPTITFHDNSGGQVPGLAECSYIKLGTAIFARDTMSNFRSRRGAGEPYILDAILFMMERRAGSYGEYLQEARRLGLGVVSLVDRKDLVTYLEEEQSPQDCPSIDTSLPLPVPRRSFVEEETGVEGRDDSILKVEETVVQPLTTVPLVKKIKTRPARRRDAPLLGSHHDDFSNVLEVAKELHRTLADSMATSPVAASTADTPKAASLMEQIATFNKPASSQKTRNDRRPDVADAKFVPIIIVPAAPTATLTMYNAQQFLEASVFRTTADAKAQGRNKENSVVFEHRFGTRTLKFQLTDNPSRLQSSDWDRVVAVFVQGNTWQFKGWKWEQPPDLFQNVKGFYLEFDDVKTEGNVANWNVHRLTISRSRRHLDSTAAFQFWGILEEYLRSNRRL